MPELWRRCRFLLKLRLISNGCFLMPFAPALPLNMTLKHDGSVMLYGHSLPDKPEALWQTLDDHHRGVSALASSFADFGLAETAGLLGRIHDIGKRSDSFQNRLRGKGGKVDHTTAAYLYLLDQWQRGDHAALGRAFAKLFAYPLLGHHGGMPDYGSQADGGTLLCRISGKTVQAVPDWKKEGLPQLPDVGSFAREVKPFMIRNGGPDGFAAAFLLRMLYSCLVDADFLDTERFCSPDRHGLRPVPVEMEPLEKELLRRLSEKGFLPDAPVEESELSDDAPCGSESRRGAIRLARAFMLQRCLAAAGESPGLFSLTMPTGGGKTLSSLAFALRHARIHGLRRVILVVPYTSIIEQNADIIRQMLGEDSVLEHHSNYTHPDEESRFGNERADLAYKLSTENWDAAVIVTTSVQFFESLFNNRPSRCRKLHNMARSVIVLDEVQMLPVPYLNPCLAALKTLSGKYGSSVVLCTATQPALLKSSFLEEGFPPENVRSIVPASVIPTLYRIFKRSRVEDAGGMSDERIVECLRQERQALCIVNSRKYARELFEKIEGGEETFHLSARMTPAHRTKELDRIRQRLKEDLPCRVVSTSLIECGVDISFPVVMREKNGLDALAQSAGRCNREGQSVLGRVILFSSERPRPKRASDLNRRCQAFDAVSAMPDLFSPETIQAYFKALYSVSPRLLDEKKILEKTKIDLGGMEFMFRFDGIARDFRFIEDDTANVVIERDEAVALLCQLGPYGVFSPMILRKLQRHSIQVYRYELERMKKDGRIEVRGGFLNVLSGGIGYSERTGLDVTLENGVPVEDLMF